MMEGVEVMMEDTSELSPEKWAEKDRTAKRDNSNKATLGMVLEFGSGLEKLAMVMKQGATKYEPRNWLLGGKPDSEYLDAALRHMEKFVNEGFYDEDIGTAHLANAAWNLLAVMRLNYGTMEALDPDFDQDAFLEKYDV